MTPIELKNRRFSFLDKPWAAYLTLFILMLVLHSGFTLGQNDDAVYVETLTYETLAAFSSRMYNTWSSRQLIEAVMVNVIRLPALWRMLDSLMFVLAAYSVANLCGSGAAFEAWASSGLMLLHPLEQLVSAGWVATTVNYLWPAALGLFAAVGLKKALCREHISPALFALNLLALLFAANAEQMCGALLIASAASVFWNRRSAHRGYPVAALLVCVAELVYIMTCPGVAERRVAETAAQFPSFDGVPLWMKLEMGFSSTINHFVFKSEIVFLVFSAFLLAAVIVNSKKTFARVAAAVPFAASAVVGFMQWRLSFSELYMLSSSIGTYGTLQFPYSFKAFAPVVFMLGVFGCTAAAVYHAFPKREQSLAALLILACGFAGRMSVSLSPTIWVSGNRTFTCLYFAFYAVTAMLMLTLKDADKKWTPALMTAFGIISAFGFFNSLLTNL